MQRTLLAALAAVAAAAAGDVFDVPIGAIHVAEMPRGASAVFKFSLLRPSRGAVSVTILAGSALVHGSVCDASAVACVTEPGPGASDFEIRAKEPGHLLTRRDCRSAAPGAPCVVYVRATAESDVRLAIRLDVGATPGVPISDPTNLDATIGRGTWSYYKIAANAWPPLVAGGLAYRIIVTPLLGDPDLYVLVLNGGSPTTTNFTYRSISMTGPELVTVSLDAPYRSQCRTGQCDVQVGVLCFSAPTAGCHYLLSAQDVSTTMALVVGTSVPGYAAPQTMSLYTFTQTQKDVSYSFIVTPTGGDPDLYVYSSAPGPPLYPPPSTPCYSVGTGTDIVEITPGGACQCTTPTCTWYLGVSPYGATGANFTVLVSNHTGAVQLIEGQSQFGGLAQGFSNFYSFYMLPGVTFMELSVAAIYGDPDVYVTVDGSAPAPNHFQYYSSGAGGSELIRIARVDPQMAGRCSASQACAIRILVYGFSSTWYFITANIAGSYASLSEGVPMVDSAINGQYDYYVFAVPRPGVYTVTFTVTPLVGDPDLFISVESTSLTPTATPGNYNYASHGFGREVVAITPAMQLATPCGSPCRYYVGVVGWAAGGNGNATYLIVGNIDTANDTTLLLNGMPQWGHSNQNSLTLYRYFMPANTPSATFSLSPLAGASMMYVSNSVDSQGRPYPMYRYCAVSSGGVCLQWAVTGYSWSTTGSFTLATPFLLQVARWYTIGVFSTETACCYGSDFTVTVSTAKSIVQLQNGVPVQGNVSVGQYLYFKLAVTQPFANVSVTCNSGRGDADLYGSLFVQYPSAASYTYRSTSWLPVDAFSVPASDLANASQFSTAYIYISVYGFTSASFQLTAATQGDPFTPTMLVDGVMQFGRVDLNRETFYRFMILPGYWYAEVGVTAFFGDPDMYITTSGAHPSRTQYQYMSAMSEGSELITIARTDPQTAPYCGNITTICVVSIDVFGFSAAAFYIQATLAGQYSVLTDGIPTIATSYTGAYNYFIFNGPSSTTYPIQFTVTPLLGDPDMYIGVGASQSKPVASSLSSYTYSSIGFGNEQVYITPAQQVQNPCGFPCRYYIGITSWPSSTNATYHIVANVDTSNETTILINGLPQWGHAAAHTLQLYIIYVPPGSTSFSVNTIVMLGATTLYASNAVDSTGRPIPMARYCAVAPTPSTCTQWGVAGAQWNSQLTTNTLTVTSSSAGWCSDCRYIIGVFANTPQADTYGTDFIVTAIRTANSHITLSDGVTQTGAVGASAYAYYKLEISPPYGDVQIDVISFSADPDLYVSIVSPFPTTTNNQWQSTLYMGTEVVVVPAGAQVVYCAGVNVSSNCAIFIGVYGANSEPATYSITASLMNNPFVPIILTPGTPSFGVTNATSALYYQASVTLPPRSTYSFTATALLGSVFLYVKTRCTQSDVPGPRNYDYVSKLDSNTQIVVVSVLDSAYCNQCVVRLAAVGQQPSTFVFTTWNVASSLNTVVNGVPAYGNVNQGTYVYYVFNFANTPGVDINIQVTSFSGDADVYVKTSAAMTNPMDYPTLFNSQWSASSAGADIVNIKSSDPGYCTLCGYYIGVYGFSSNASYSILVTATAQYMVPLSNGVPQRVFVGALAYRFFTYSFANHPEAMTISAVALSGQLELRVTNVYSASVGTRYLPTRDGLMVGWTDLYPIGGAYRVNIPVPNPLKRTYTIGVYGKVDSQFIISVQGNVSYPELLPGVPSVTRYISLNTVHVYTFQVWDLGMDLSVVAAPNFGSVAVYVNNNATAPVGCGTSTAANNYGCMGFMYGNYGSGGTVSIDHTNPCSGAQAQSNCYVTGFYTVAVVGTAASSQYSVTFAQGGDHIILADGVPSVTVTDRTTVCSPRSPTGQCTGTASLAQVAWYQFEASYTTQVVADIAVTVEHYCPSSESACRGAPNLDLSVYIVGCSNDQCTIDDTYPYVGHYQEVATLSKDDVRTSILLPRAHPSYCQSTQGCQYYVGVVVNCVPGAVGCRAQWLRVTMSTNSGLTLIPADCLSGALCVLPEDTIGTGYKTYEAYTGLTAGTTPLSISFDACTGNVVLYVCYTGAKASNCAFPNSPNATDFDLAISTNSMHSGSGVVNARNGVYFTAVGDSASASFEVAVWAGTSALQLIGPGSHITVAANSVATSITVTWLAAGNPSAPGIAASGAQYTVTAIPLAYIAPSANKYAACGIDDIVANAPSGAGITQQTATLSVVLAGLEYSTQYFVVVVASCTGSAGCAVGSMADQRATYSGTMFTTAAPAGSGGSGPGAGSPGVSGGAVGGIIAAVAVVSIGGGAFWWWRRRQAGSNPYYAKPMPVDAMDDQYASLTTDA